jgi:hypothetical protein
MRLQTLITWRNIQNVDETQPLYRKLWFLHYRRSLWAASSGYPYSLMGMSVAVLLAPLFLLLPWSVGPLFGTFWATFIAGMIRYEYAQDRFELIGVLPGGGLAAYRTIALLHLRRSRLYYHLHEALNITGLVGGMLIFLMVSGLLVGLASPAIATNEGVLSILVFTVNVMIVVGALYTEQVQAVVLSLCVGMAAPLHSRSTLEARLWGASGYVALQLIAVGAAATVGFGVVPGLLSAGPWQFPMEMLTTAMILFTLREMAIRHLLAYIARSLGPPA